MDRTLDATEDRGAGAAIESRQPEPGLVPCQLDEDCNTLPKNIRVSRQTAGDSEHAVQRPVDNASCESFMKTLKRKNLRQNYNDLEIGEQNNIGKLHRAYYCTRRWLSTSEEFEQQMRLISRNLEAQRCVF